MKKSGIAFLIYLGVVFIIQIILGVLVIAFDSSWWWFFGFLIFFTIVSIIWGAILLVLWFIKKQKPIFELDEDTAIERIVKEMKEDKHNPDNFIIKIIGNCQVGEKGTNPTPVLIVSGYGTELLEDRTVIMNLHTERKTILINPTMEEIEKAATKIADYPPEFISEIVTHSSDNLGRQITTSRIIRPNYNDLKKEQEKKEVDTKNAT